MACPAFHRSLIVLFVLTVSARAENLPEQTGHEHVCRMNLSRDREFLAALPPRLRFLLQRNSLDRIHPFDSTPFTLLHASLDQAMLNHGGVIWLQFGKIDFKIKVSVSGDGKKLTLEVPSVEEAGVKLGTTADSSIQFYRLLMGLSTWLGKVNRLGTVRTVRVVGADLRNRKFTDVLNSLGFTQKYGAKCALYTLAGGGAGSMFVHRGKGPDHILEPEDRVIQIAYAALGAGVFAWLGCTKYGSDFSLEITLSAKK